jgi:hypothetical protein
MLEESETKRVEDDWAIVAEVSQDKIRIRRGFSSPKTIVINLIHNELLEEIYFFPELFLPILAAGC